MKAHRLRDASMAAIFFIVAAGLPSYFLQYRSDRLRCSGGIDYQHCTAGTPYTLVMPLGLIGRGAVIPYADPPIAFFIDGIYARKGYSAPTAKVLGIYIPIGLLCIAAYLTIRALRRLRPRNEEGRKSKLLDGTS